MGSAEEQPEAGSWARPTPWAAPRRSSGPGPGGGGQRDGAGGRPALRGSWDRPGAALDRSAPVRLGALPTAGPGNASGTGSPVRGGAGASTWEYRQLSFPRGTAKEAARSVLVEAAEVERWELARLRLHPDGRRTVWLRRRVLRVARTA